MEGFVFETSKPQHVYSEDGDNTGGDSRETESDSSSSSKARESHPFCAH